MIRDSRIRVAINALSIAPGGGLTGILGYLNAWRELNWEFKVYSSRQDVSSQIADLGFPVTTLWTELPAARRFWLQQTRLGTMIEREGANVVMTTNFLVGNCSVPQLVHHRNLKHFTSLRGSLRKHSLRELIRDRVALNAVRNSERNVFVSETLRSAAESLVPRAHAKNYVVPNGLSEDYFFQSSVDDVSATEPMVIGISSPSSHKDNPTLLRAFRLISTSASVPLRLTIAGDGDWSEERRLAESLGIGAAVDFVGFLSPPQLRAKLARAQCALFTSKLESFGNGPLEAIAMGCPVVAADIPASREVLADSAILVQPGDHQAFAKAVRQIIADKSLRSELRAGGYERAKLFRWTRAAELMASHLLETSRLGNARSLCRRVQGFAQSA